MCALLQTGHLNHAAIVVTSSTGNVDFELAQQVETGNL